MISRLTTLKPRIAALDTRTAKPPPKQTLPFYSSPEWKKLIAQIIAERGRRCEECGRTGCRIFGDHMIELKDGGAPLDPNGIRLLCGSCHSKKTAAEKRKREQRSGPTR